MKKFPLILILALFPLIGFSQSYDIKWGGVSKEPRLVFPISVIGKSGDDFLILKGKMAGLLRGQWKNVTIQRFDKGLDPAQTAELPMKAEGKDLEVEFSFKSGNKIFLFSSFRNQKLEKKFLFVQEIDRKSLLPTGKMRKIAETKYRNRYRPGQFDFEFSRDSSKILIYTNTHSKKKEPEKYGFHVFDKDMVLEWEKEVTLPYSEQLFGVEDYVVDNDGNTYLVGLKYDERPVAKRHGNPNYDYHILAYRGNGKDEKEYKVKLDDRFITDLMIEVTPGKDIICAGFYSEKGTWSIKGTYYLKVDHKTEAIKHKSFHEFGMDFITMNFTARQERKAEKKAAKGKNVELYEYDLDDIIPRADGGAVIVAEQFFIRVVTSYNASTRTTTTRTYYYYNTIIVVSVDPQGNIEWATKVPKKQVSVDDGGIYSSYAKMVTPGKLFFIFNDNAKNYSKDLAPGKRYNFNLGDRNGVVAIASVDTEGNVEVEPLISNDDMETITMPKFCRQTTKTDMLIYGKRKRGNQYGRIKF